MREILICVPSKGRAKTCSTHKLLPSCKYFVAPEEAEEYITNVGPERVCVVPEGVQIAPSGKCRTLNWILDNYKKPGNVILFSDDDINRISRPDFGNLHDNSGVIVTEPELRELIDKMARIAEIVGAKIGGCSALSSPDILQMGLSGGFRLQQKAYIDGKAFIVYEDDGTRFDETLYLKEDIDFNCQSLRKNGRTLSAPFVVFVGKALTNRGGVVDYRTNEKELEQGSMLLKKHPGMLRLRISQKGSGVRKKAVQFGLR